MAATLNFGGVPSSVYEGEQVIFPISLTNFIGDHLTYTISGVGITKSDIDIALTGILSISSFYDGSSSLKLNIAEDQLNEGPEGFYVTFAGGNLSPTNSPGASIRDTSKFTEWISEFEPGQIPTGSYEGFKVSTRGTGGAIYVAVPVSSSGVQTTSLLEYQPDGSWKPFQSVGTYSITNVYGMAAGQDGSIYVSGRTLGYVLDGYEVKGDGSFITKYDATGHRVWTALDAGFNIGAPQALTVDFDGSIYLAHVKNVISPYGLSIPGGALITKYQADGTKAWTKLIKGTYSEPAFASDITIGLDGALYVCGRASDGGSYSIGMFLDAPEELSTSDAFISKLQPDGTIVYTARLGRVGLDDYASAITTGLDGDLYVTGSKNGVNSTGYDAFIARFHPDGTHVWTKVLVGNADDQAHAITTGLDGSIYISGETKSDILDGQPRTYGLSSAFIAKYQPDGNNVWTKLLVNNDFSSRGYTLTTGLDGAIYMGGQALPPWGQGYGTYAILLKVPLQPSYEISSKVLSVDEGSAVTFTVVTTDVPINTVLSYTLSGTGITAKDIAGASTVGVTTVGPDGTATFTVDLLWDQLQEGPETLKATVQGRTAAVIINDRSTGEIPTYSLSVNSLRADEGGAIRFTLATTNVSPNTLVTYALSGTYITSTDIGGASLVGTTTVGADGTATFTVKLAADQLTEGDETLTVTSQGKISLVTVSDTSTTPPTYKLTAISGSVNEGSSATFTVATTNVASGSQLAYILSGSGIDTADIDGASLTGKITVAENGTASFTVNLATDHLTEGAETLIATVMNQSASVTVNDISTTPAPTYSLTAIPTSVNEGSAVTFTLMATNVTDNTVLNYTLTGAGIEIADLVGGSLTGTTTVNAYGTASFTVNIATDQLTEGAETLTATVMGQSVSVTVNDTSITMLIRSDWTKLLGNTGYDVSNALTTGLDGAIYMSGTIYAGLGGTDAFITKYLPDGTKAWTNLPGGAGNDDSRALTTGLDGSIYVSGGTSSVTLDGQTSSGLTDAFITKYLPNGTWAWTKLLGGTKDDGARALTTGLDGSIYMSGSTDSTTLDGQWSDGGHDVFLTKYLPNGTRAWTKLLGGTKHDGASALTTGLDGSIYVSGYTDSTKLEGQTSNGSTDAFITKYLPDGTKAWTKLLGGTKNDGASALTTGLDGSIYMSGSTDSTTLDGQTSNGSAHAFITKYLPDGTKAWTKLLSGAGDDDYYALALTTGFDGSIYVSGGTSSARLDGQTSNGSTDAFITKYLPDGTKAWTKLLGGAGDDYSGALITGLDGSIYVGGGTSSVTLDGQTSNGSQDAFITKLIGTPTYIFTSDTSSVNEGGAATFTVSTTNIAQGTQISYTLGGTGINTVDVVGGQLIGTATVDAKGQATFKVTLVADQLTEGNEVLTATVQVQTASVTVNDTSMTAIASVNQAPTGSVTISGTPTQGQTLTAANTLADRDGLGTISYQWSAGGTAITGATSSTYVLTQAEVGKTITATANYTDAFSTAESKTSSATTAVISPDTLAPTITTFSPADEAAGVAIAANIVLTFSEALALGTGNIVLKTAAGVTVATYSAATSTNLSISGSTLTINPTADLGYSTAYKVEFAAGTIKDGAGNSYAGTTSYNFTTTAAPDTTAPTITTFSPADEATGIGLSSNIVLTFSESVVARSGGTIELMTDYGSGHQSVEVFSVSDVTRVKISGNVVTIDPTSALLPSTGYHLGFNSALADTAGNAFSYTHGQYNFTTVATSSGNLRGIAYDWKNHMLLQDVAVSVKGGGPPTEGANAPIQFKGLVWDASGHASVEVWTHAPAAVQNAGFGLEITNASGITFTAGTLPNTSTGGTGWTLIANAVGTNLTVASFANDSTAAIAAGDLKLGTVTFETATAQRADLHLLSGDVGTANASAYGLSMARTSSSAAGAFSISTLEPGSYGVTASRTTSDIGNAITSADALAALKMAVGLNPNPDPDGTGPLSAPVVSPYQFMAADVIGTDGRVTSADALAILKMAVKLPTAPAKEWLFVEESRDFWNEATGQFTLNRNSTGWDHSISTTLQTGTTTGTVNLVGVLKGDVNGSWAAPAGSTDLDTIDPTHFTALSSIFGMPVGQFGVV